MSTFDFRDECNKNIIYTIKRVIMVKNIKNKVLTSLPTVVYCFWKNHVGKPSGLGAPSGYIEKRASLISCSINSFVRS